MPNRCSWAYQAGITHDSLTRIPFMVISPWLSPIMLKFSYHSDILNLFLAHRSQAKAMNPYPTDPYGHPPRGMGYRESIRDPYNLKVRNVNQPRYHSWCVTATLELIFASLELAVLERKHARGYKCNHSLEDMSIHLWPHFEELKHVLKIGSSCFRRSYRSRGLSFGDSVTFHQTQG